MPGKEFSLKFYLSRRRAWIEPMEIEVNHRIDHSPLISTRRRVEKTLFKHRKRKEKDGLARVEVEKERKRVHCMI